VIRIVVCTVNGESGVMSSGDSDTAAIMTSTGTASTTVRNGDIKCDGQQQQQQHSNAVSSEVSDALYYVCKSVLVLLQQE